MELLSADIGDIASIQWFIAIEVDENRYAERVTFTGYDNGMQVSCWEVPLDVKPTALAGVTEQLPEPVKIKKARVSVKRKDKNKDAQNDGQ
ncbi:peroxidase [Shewanella algae]|nr:peroxidase [Shewanella algae]